MAVNWTYCGDYFVIYTNIESLCCTPKTNMCQLYLKKSKQDKQKQCGTSIKTNIQTNRIEERVQK